MLNVSLGGMKEGASGGGGFNLGDTCHLTDSFQMVNCLIRFTVAFVTENVSNGFGVCLRGLRIQDTAMEEVTAKFGCQWLQLVVVQRGCLIISFGIDKGGLGGIWERAFLAQPADLGGTNVVSSLFPPHQEPELLEEVILHQVWGEGNLAHPKFPAMLLCMLHALRLKGVEFFQMWAKQIPVKIWEGSLREEGGKLGKKGVALGRFQEEKVIGVMGGRDRACEPLHLGLDNLQPRFAN